MLRNDAVVNYGGRVSGTAGVGRNHVTTWSSVEAMGLSRTGMSQDLPLLYMLETAKKEWWCRNHENYY